MGQNLSMTHLRQPNFHHSLHCRPQDEEEGDELFYMSAVYTLNSDYSHSSQYSHGNYKCGNSIISEGTTCRASRATCSGSSTSTASTSSQSQSQCPSPSSARYGPAIGVRSGPACGTATIGTGSGTGRRRLSRKQRTGACLKTLLEQQEYANSKKDLKKVTGSGDGRVRSGTGFGLGFSKFGLTALKHCYGRGNGHPAGRRKNSRVEDEWGYFVDT